MKRLVSIPRAGGALASTLIASVLACSPAAPTPRPQGTVTPPPPTTAEAPFAFANPGGMWAPEQLAGHADTLKKLGLALDPAAMTDPMAFPLGAIVYLGGCSASFVSGEGLIITNHHCATGALQLNSKKGDNLLKDGYLAKTRADEKNNGPSARVFVTQKFTDVTAKVRAALAQEKDDQRRYELVETREKELIADCEKGRPEIRCSVVSYFGGEKFVLVEQLEIRDVRLVYAPPESVGAFGGETDNWQWPRHSGDFAFFRAYVGPDGKPADFAAGNVPYRPRHHLKVASKPLKQGDLVFVAGYPAHTTRLRTSDEVKAAVDWFYPKRIEAYDEYIDLLQKLGKEDETLAIKGGRLLRGLSNRRKNYRGMLDGLVKGGLKEQKAAQERKLATWAEQQPQHGDAAAAITRIGQHYAKYRAARDKDSAAEEAFRFSTLLGAADTIVRMAEERPKPDAERDPAFQERNHKRIEQGQQSRQRTYDRRLDSELVVLALMRASRLPADQQPEVLGMILGKAKASEPQIRAAVDALYAGTTLDKLETRLELLRGATLASLKKSKDPILQLALKHRPILRAIDDRDEGYAGAMTLDRPKFATALRAFRGGSLAPDANRTLRVTYGTVRGYKKTPDAVPYEPFTKLSGMVAKHERNQGNPEFDAPADLLEAARQGPYGGYVHPPLGEVPVCFLADLDITGGNSGSPTLNARGELVGLAFDGNYEAMASDWIFIPSITRSIHVDIRYTLWMMDRVAKADHLLRELGIEPSLK